ncbi:MAG: thiol peroxidase [Candidatus Caenarcaniphilales bacterium]|nr:thiol peroxidase [Candidatus Caenarcaniphilales bacterium]
MQVTFKGNPLNLEGNQPQVGQTAPDFQALNSSLEAVNLSQLGNETILLNIVPSLDTPVCAKQSKEFYSALKDKPVKLVTVSMDLPFAQARFCGAENVEIQTLSDHKDASFGKAYGLLIKELRLLSRAVIIIDKDKKVQYIEIVPEVTSEPNYEAALKALNVSGVTV